MKGIGKALWKDTLILSGLFIVMLMSQDIAFAVPNNEVDVRNYVSFSAAIDDIGTAERSLLIPNQQDVTANKTVPSNVTLRFIKGGYLNISTGVTVTINGHVDAELYQIFSGAGSVSFGSGAVKEAHPEWWGIDGTSDQVEINKAIDAAGHVVLSRTYYVNGPIVVKANKTLSGKGMVSKISSSASNVNTLTINGDFATVTDLYFYGPGSATTVPNNRCIIIMTDAGGVVNSATIKNCVIENFEGTAIMGSYMYATIENNTICCIADEGIWISSNCTNNLIKGNTIHNITYAGIDINGSFNRVIGNYSYSNGGGALDKAAWSGILVHYAGGTYMADFNIISENYLYNNRGPGIQISGLGGTTILHPFGNVISKNVAFNHTNTTSAQLVPAGIAVYGGDCNLIDGNYCYNNYHNFAFAGWQGLPGNYNSVINNYSLAAVYDGYHFGDDGGEITGGSGHSDQVLLANNFDRYAGRDSFRFEPYNNNLYRYRIYNNQSEAATGYGFKNTYVGRFTDYLFEPSNIARNAGTAATIGLGPVPLTANVATPAIGIGELYQTSNTTPIRTFTNFTGGTIGQHIIVMVTDAFTKFDFSGTNLKGNGGVDWTASNGDWVDGTFDGTNWRLAVHDSTP